MSLDGFFDLILDVIIILEEWFNDLRLTLFGKTLSFADFFCVIVVFELITYIVHGGDDE